MSDVPEPSVAFFLINLGRRTRAAVESALVEHGLTFRHVAALGHLHRDPGLSYSDLARRSGVSVQSIQSTIAQLIDTGLVQRGPSAGQGRRADLTLTDQGRKALSAGVAAIRSVDDELLRDLNPTDRARAESLLLRLFRSPVGRGE